MMKVTPRLLVAMVLLWVVTVAVQSRPATESGEPEIEQTEEPDLSVVMDPIRQLTDLNSAFGQMLWNQLLKMSVQNSSTPATTFERATVMPNNYSDRERIIICDKQSRLRSILHQLINITGHNYPSPSPTIKTDLNSVIPIQRRDAINVINFPCYPSDTVTKKTQSFYPTCDLPKHTNEDVWNTKESMNLMFNIRLPKSSTDIIVNVHTARLRLFKQFVFCYSQSSNESDDSQLCQQTSLETMKQFNMTTGGVVPIIMDERQIRVSIYLYTRSLKRKRVKRKLLDSNMVPYFSEKWTEWNIRNAAKAWQRNPVRNYGIGIEVEDEDGNLLPVAKFFRPMNCSGDAQMMTSKLVQGFLTEAVQNGNGNPTPTTNNSDTNTVDAFRFDMHRYPIMDVTTIEIPISEVNNAVQKT